MKTSSPKTTSLAIIDLNDFDSFIACCYLIGLFQILGPRKADSGLDSENWKDPLGCK